MKNHPAEISRVTRSRDQARETYDRISRWYDVLEGSWEGKPKQIGLEKLDVKPGEVVLEIGCGTGHAIAALARSVGASGRVYGVDLSRNMLAITSARIEQHELTGRTVLEQGDAVHLPFAPACFDAIFSSFVLELFDTRDIPQVLAECHRVLRSGGRIGIVSLSKASGSNWITRWYEWGHGRFPQLLDCRPIFVQRALEEGAFEIQDVMRVSLWGLPIEIVVGRKAD